MAAKLVKIALLSAVLLATACKGQPLPPDKSEFAGRWVGPGADLLIQPEGRVKWEKLEGKGRVQIEGPLQGWIEDDFVVGVMVVKTRFDVTEPPHEVDGEWVMTVNGVQLTRL